MTCWKYCEIFMRRNRNSIFLLAVKNNACFRNNPQHLNTSLIYLANHITTMCIHKKKGSSSFTTSYLNVDFFNYVISVSFYVCIVMYFYTSSQLVKHFICLYVVIMDSDPLLKRQSRKQMSRRAKEKALFLSIPRLKLAPLCV